MSLSPFGTHTWAIVLAAGEGSRLRTLTTTSAGDAVPKQFCSLNGGHSLLEETLRRAAAVAPRQRVCAVVAAQHRRWWEPALWSAPPANVVVQPQNQGTANGVLLPLLYVLERDPAARIVLLPSDHYVRDEEVLAAALRAASTQIAFRRDEILLLGIEPEDVDPELGYVVPGRSDQRGAFEVDEFVEKPSPTLARTLLERGALWNSFILAARGEALLGLYEQRFAQLVIEMRHAVRRELRTNANGWAIGELYERLPEIDFSRHVLEGHESSLRVLQVPQCGWSDLGTPRRVADCLARIETPQRVAAEPIKTHAWLSLAAQRERLEFAC
jgi:mannose-1-phosphate guanylyltransferase